MRRIPLVPLCLLATLLLPRAALAVRGSELYTSKAYGYGRFEARVRFAAGDGVVSSFFLWKDGSEKSGTFWNELDFEKLGADCHVETNAIYGNPAGNHSQRNGTATDFCTAYHTYAYEWTPSAIAWFIDGVEVRRETGAVAAAFADNAAGGMQIHFNVWPGDASFGGNFSPNILPVHQYVDWVQFSAFANGNFTLSWREEFDGSTVPSGWLTGDWASPKNLSTHDPRNVNLIRSNVVLSLTADNAVGPAGAMPNSSGGTAGTGAGGASGGSATGGSTMTAGGSGGSQGGAGNAGNPSQGGVAGMAGMPSSGGTTASGGVSAGGASPGVSGAPSGGSAGAIVSGGASSAAGSGNNTAGSSTAAGASGGLAGSGAGAGQGGLAGVSGAATTPNPPGTPPGKDNGCNIATPSSGSPLGAFGLFAIAALGLGRRRRARATR
ncbi:MAG TPA: family 16 glycosylhydrolase [Polyangiaceae bacterium]|nr:family 16 glycosylhydrolase [Polyangiaceae bacterium]